MADGLTPADVKADFPLLTQGPDRRPLVYLDSAASSQKPRAVLDAMDHYYETTHANVHRGVYRLAEEATAAFEDARTKVARFIGAPSAPGVVFTKNATEAINLVAHSYGRHCLPAGKAILLTEMEHHANLVPWLMLREEKGVELRYLPGGRRRHPRPRRPRPPARRGRAGERHRHVERPGHAQPRSAGWPTRPTRWGRSCWSTARSTSPTCPPTWPTWAATCSPSPATRCAGPPASACCGAGRSCSTPCPPSSAAAR